MANNEIKPVTAWAVADAQGIILLDSLCWNKNFANHKLAELGKDKGYTRVHVTITPTHQ